MNLEALNQLLESLNINPDEIEDERYTTAFRILFAIIEKQNEEIGCFSISRQNGLLRINNHKIASN
jgi:hypothetical protein